MGFFTFKTRQSETQQVPAREDEWSANGFKQIWESGIYIVRTDANRSDAIDTLENDTLKLRPMTYLELLTELPRRPNVMRELEGKVIHIHGTGTANGYGIFDGNTNIPTPDHYTFNDKADLSPGKGDPWKTVQVYRGRHPLSFYIPMRHSVENIGANFIIFANQHPSEVLSIVVGVKKDVQRHMQPASEDGKMFDSLLRVA